MVTKQPYQCFDIDCDCVGWHASCKFDDGRTFCWHGEMFPVEYVPAQKRFNPTKPALMDDDTFMSVFEEFVNTPMYGRISKDIEEVFKRWHAKHDK